MSKNSSRNLEFNQDSFCFIIKNDKDKLLRSTFNLEFLISEPIKLNEPFFLPVGKTNDIPEKFAYAKVLYVSPIQYALMNKAWRCIQVLLSDQVINPHQEANYIKRNIYESYFFHSCSHNNFDLLQFACLLDDVYLVEVIIDFIISTNFYVTIKQYPGLNSLIDFLKFHSQFMSDSHFIIKLLSKDMGTIRENSCKKCGSSKDIEQCPNCLCYFCDKHLGRHKCQP